MELSLQDWGAIGEIIGGFAVVVTLIYLSVQLRQTNNAIRISTMNVGAETNGLVFQHMFNDPDFVDLFINANENGLDSLDRNERTRFIMFCNSAMRFIEHQYLLHINNALPDGVWDTHERNIQEFMASGPATRDAWEANKPAFLPGFQDLVASLPDDDNYSILSPGQSLSQRDS
jgi:hypothetical protein